MTTPRQLRKIEAIHREFHRLSHNLLWNTRPSPERAAVLQKLEEARDLEIVKARRTT